MKEIFGAIAIALAQTGDVSETLKGLADADAKVRLKATSTLSEWPVALPPKAIVELGKAIDDASPAVRRIAIQTLGEIGPRSRQWAGGVELSNRVAKHFQDKEPAVRQAAIWTFGQLGVDDPKELEPLFDISKHVAPDVRRVVLLSLSQYLHDGVSTETRERIAETLVGGLDDKEARVYTEAGRLLAAGGKDVVPALAAFVEKKSGEPRLRAILVLGVIGPPAHDAIPTLRKALNSVPAGSRKYVQQAIQNIGE